MTEPRSSAADPRLPDIIESSDDGDRPSITEVNGTVARFEMAYSPNPNERFFFGAPTWQKLPSLLYLGFAIAIGAIALVGWNTPGTALHRWIVDGNKAPIAIIVVITAVGGVMKQMLRGVVVTRDAIEARTVSLGFPRVKKWSWAQIDRLVLDGEQALLELWDGSYERLPKVAEGKKLVDLLERVALGRGRQVTRLDDAKR